MSTITSFLSADDKAALKAELQNLRRKGALKPSTDWDSTGQPDQDRICGRCRIELGRVINRGAYCRACRLKVCKNCREYSFRTTDWVCTVCHKHMEIQAASGEWMDEFVRRPSRRRDNRVYLPAADIIKRTIRRSWTISNPTPIWNKPRASADTRLYNSLPRGAQDYSNYPYLVQLMKNQANYISLNDGKNQPMQCRRSQSEDVYNERTKSLDNSKESECKQVTTTAGKMRLIAGNSTEKMKPNLNKRSTLIHESEKRVSFGVNESNQNESTIQSKTQILDNNKKTLSSSLSYSTSPLKALNTNNGDLVEPLCDIEPLSGTVFRKVTVRRKRQQEMKKMAAVDSGCWRSEPSITTSTVTTSTEKDNNNSELDILFPAELRRRRNNYKLVFLTSSSESSSSREEEEEQDFNFLEEDCDSSSSSFPIDECDWDYFDHQNEPNLLKITSGSGTPLPLRESSEISEQTVSLPSEEATKIESPTLVLNHHQASYTKCCQSCGAPGTRYIPIPVPVPFPVPFLQASSTNTSGTNKTENENSDEVIVYDQFAARTLWANYMSRATLIWPNLFDDKYFQFGNNSPIPPVETVSEEMKTIDVIDAVKEDKEDNKEEDKIYSDSSSTSSTDGQNCVYHVNSVGEDNDPENYIVDVTDNDDNDVSDSSDSCGGNDTDSDVTSKVGEKKTKKFSRTFVVNRWVQHGTDSTSSSESECSSKSSESDNDTDTEMDCTVILTNVRQLNEDDSFIKNTNSNTTNTEDNNNSNNGELSSPGLSDVSAETLDSSDVEQKLVVATFGEDDGVQVEILEKEKEEDMMSLIEVVGNATHHSEQQPAGVDGLVTEVKPSSLHVIDRKREDFLKQQQQQQENVQSGAPRYTSLVMITQEKTSTPFDTIHAPSPPPPQQQQQQVSVVTSDTTTVVASDEGVDNCDIIVRHTNWNQEKSSQKSSKKLTDDNDQKLSRVIVPPPLLPTTGGSTNGGGGGGGGGESSGDDVTVIIGGDTLSAFEEGLADDDSWVENISHSDNSSDNESSTDNTTSDGEEITLTCSSSTGIDSDTFANEDELRGYHRGAIDFTLHTIVEESCEESEVESCNLKVINTTKNNYNLVNPSNDLEKYFFFRLGGEVDEGTSGSANNNVSVNNNDTISESSSICSEGVESSITGGGADIDGISEDGEDSKSMHHDDNDDLAEMASSRLEKYFLSGFMGFDRRDSDGSVGSDSEGQPSPEQRRKRLVRARGSGRSHSSSLDNLLTNPDLVTDTQQQQQQQQQQTQNSDQLNPQQNSGSSSRTSSDTDEYNTDNVLQNINFEKTDGQFDTVKRKKSKKVSENKLEVVLQEIDYTNKEIEETEVEEGEEDIDDSKSPQSNESTSNLTTNKNQQSRDSGFVGSCDDLLREPNNSNNVSAPEFPSTPNTSSSSKMSLQISEDKRINPATNTIVSTPLATSITRKDSFNNWSSDEETNIMMCKMRQFFKSMVQQQQQQATSKPSTPTLIPPSRLPPRKCFKPPQLVYFENELTRLMKTVPGLRDDQVREIVEYLSSEDTWSDSYDSSDYTSSDLEGSGTCVSGEKSALQQEISESCQLIINKFDNSVGFTPSDVGTHDHPGDEEGDEGDGGIVYQKLVASFEKMAANSTNESTSTDNALSGGTNSSSPPLIAKVMHHIGSRLVALMHEVSSNSGDSLGSPKMRHYHHHYHHHHRRNQQKGSSSSAASSTTTEDADEDSLIEDINDIASGTTTTSRIQYLQRSRSHDLLTSDTNQSRSARFHHNNNTTSPQSQTSQQSGGMAIGPGGTSNGETGETSDCERFSWRGSFESALLAADSRNRLSVLSDTGTTSSGGAGGASGTNSANVISPNTNTSKRRSAGDLLYAAKYAKSREHLDRVRSCGSIGEERSWTGPLRRSSVPDASESANNGAIDEDIIDNSENMSTAKMSANSLPRLPAASSTNYGTTLLQKAQSMYHVVASQNQHQQKTQQQSQPQTKSARYRPPGFTRFIGGGPKRAVSAPGLQHHRQRGTRRTQPNIPSDDISLSEAHSSPMLVAKNSGGKSATPSPSSRRGRSVSSSQDWSSSISTANDDDIDRLANIHQARSSLSSLGLRSDSMASVYSGAGEGRYGTVPIRGQIEFGLQYNYKSSSLDIQIKQCKDLAAVDVKRQRSDPYVKVYLLPDKSKSGKRKTKVKKHTLNPVFEECLKFNIGLDELESRTIWLTVWHSDMFGRNDFLGEVMMTLENKVFDEPTPKWYNLQERTEPFDDMLSLKGDIIVCLKFVPPDMSVQKKGKRSSRGTLYVLVKEAKNLIAVKANGTSDPFCKSYLLPDKGRSSKQKTSVAKRTVNPVWNHTFTYDDVTLQELAERCLELTIWDHDRLASNEFLGSVKFSLGTGKHYGKTVDWMDASGKEHSLWKNMLERPNFWVEGCLSLRSSLEGKN